MEDNLKEPQDNPAPVKPEAKKEEAQKPKEQPKAVEKPKATPGKTKPGDSEVNAKDKVIKEAKSYLKQYQDKEMYATEDGNIWRQADKNLAVDYAHKTKQELITVKP